MGLLFETAHAAAGTASSQSNPMGSFLLIGIFMAAVYFILLRPQNKKVKEHRDLVSKLAKGDEVVTSGGIMGKIIKIGDSFVVLSVSENVEISFQKNAIANILPKGMMKQVSN